MAIQYHFRYCIAMLTTARETYRDRLFDVALEQNGFVTTHDAKKLGIPTVELRKLANRGKLENVARGVYKFPKMKNNLNDIYLEATLRVGPDAYLAADAVLAFHNLAQVNPRSIRVGARRRVRRQLPKQVVVLQTDHPENCIEVRGGVRMTRVAQAIVDCKEIVMRERLGSALKEAIDLSLITSQEVEEVKRELS